METQGSSPRPWYKKKRYIAILAILSVVTVANFSGSETSTVQNNQIISPVVSQPLVSQVNLLHVETTQKQQSLPSSETNQGLSNDNHYTNTYGNEVHSPAYSNTTPVGASAQCKDGTYSFSQSRRGTCSHHGGVAEWL